MAWEILYDDGRRYSAGDGAYWQAPRTGVQAVVQDCPETGVESVYSPDGWWIWMDGRWYGTEREGKDDYLRSHMSPEICVLQGRWVSLERWREIQREIEARKTAWWSHERRVRP